MKCRRILVSLTVLLVAVGLSVPASAGQPSFQGLGYDPGWHAITRVSDVSADGRVVVGTTNLLGGPDQAFRWTEAEGMIPLTGLPEGMSGSSAWAVSADGEVIVGDCVEPHSVIQSEFVVRAFRWTRSGGMESLPRLSQMLDTTASGVSADGGTVVGNTFRFRAPFRWVASGEVQSLDRLVGHFGSRARAVSGDGSAVAGDSTGIRRSWQAWRWTASEGTVGLGDPPGGPSSSGAEAISADGTTVVGWSEAVEWFLLFRWTAEEVLAFRWTAEEGMVTLGDLPGGSVDSVALDVSADGSIIVGESDGALGGEAFIWDGAHGMRSLKTVLTEEYGLDLSGWELGRAEGISDDGMTIVGEGVNPMGFDEAWIAVVPEPGVLAFMVAGGVFASFRRRRGRAAARLVRPGA